METFWNTIASYNAATWPAQLALTLAAVVLTLLLYFRPSPAVRIAMKVFMALLNFWIAGVYYLANYTNFGTFSRKGALQSGVV